MIKEIDLEQTCLLALDIVADARDFILKNKNSKLNVEEKSDNNFVTHVDKGSEKILVDGLKSVLPIAGFIAEEGTASANCEEYKWVIDPLDGTTNFMHGIPCYAISVGLLRKNIPVLGIIYEINLNECFYAWKGGGSFLNGKKISVSKTTSLKSSLVATGFPYHDYGRLNQYLELLKHMVQQTHGLRRIGSAATDLAYVACGRFDAFYEYGLSPWDVAAGVVIVEEAGGKCSDFSGTMECVFNKEIAASNALIQQELINNIAQHFNCT